MLAYIVETKGRPQVNLKCGVCGGRLSSVSLELDKRASLAGQSVRPSAPQHWGYQLFFTWVLGNELGSRGLPGKHFSSRAT